MAVDDDPRTTIKGIVDLVFLVPGAITNDIGGNATVVSVWEGGPEGLIYLFYGAPGADVLLTFGEPRSREMRRVEDIPVHYLMSYPVTVTTMNKPNVTAARMQYKVTYLLRDTIENAARSGPGVPAYRLHIITDNAKHKRIGYSDIWEANHIVEYETGYP